MTDFITDYLAYTDGITSPPIFRLWCAIAAISGALERRVWVETARSALYPNLYIVLVAPPGVGKDQAIINTSEMWVQAKKFYVAPDSLTKASLIDSLKEADRKILNGHGILQYHSLLVVASELGVLVPAHDLEFLSVLNKIYDNPRAHREKRRTVNGGKDYEIIHPQLTILAGTQPGFLGSLLPEEAWKMGTTSRLIMIYAQSAPRTKLFGKNDPRTTAFNALTKRLTDLAAVMGQFIFAPEAEAELERWSEEGLPPIPDHTKLEHYIPRRIIHILKLCMVSAISRGEDLIITLADVNRARDWLLEAEMLMPDIFREMHSRSDSTVIQELHIFLWKLFAKDQRPIHEGRLIHFLQNKVPSEKILRVIEIAEKSNIINRMAGTQYYSPRPRHEHGLE